MTGWLRRVLLYIGITELFRKIFYNFYLFFFLFFFLASVATTPSIPVCVDLKGPGGVSNCAEHANLCNDPLYYNLMTQQCPKTCDRCPGQTPTPCKLYLMKKSSIFHYLKKPEKFL